jgi:hypothetical protein
LSFLGRLGDLFFDEFVLIEKGIKVDERGKVCVPLNGVGARSASFATRTWTIVIVRTESIAHS